MTFKSMLLSSALALTTVMAADQPQPAALQQGAAAENQTVRLRFATKDGGTFTQAVTPQETRLDLSHNQFIGEIPKEIGNLTNLEILGLSCNQFTGPIPKEIGNLTNLLELYLSHNQLTGEIPKEIGNLTNLEILGLSFNQFTGGIPATIGDLTNLIRLYLYDNHLTGEIPAAIGELKNLLELYLYNNQLTGDIPEGVWGLPKLEWLNIHGNALFGREIITSGRKINVNTFFFVETDVQQDGICMVNILNEWQIFRSHFNDNGVWQEELIVRKFASFTALSLPLQALLIAELANYGYAQEMQFTFPYGAGVLTIHPVTDGQTRVITVSDQGLNALKTALETLHMSLGEFRTLAENGQHPVGLVYLEAGKQTKSANKI